MLFTTQNGGYVTRSSYRRMRESIVKKTKAVADAEFSSTAISAEKAQADSMKKLNAFFKGTNAI